MFVRQCLQESRALVSISVIKRMRHYETLAQKLQAKTTVTFVILAASISALWRVWRSSNISPNLPPSFLSAGRFEQIYLTTKFVRCVRRIDGSGLDSWAFTDGCSNAELLMKLCRI